MRSSDSLANQGYRSLLTTPANNYEARQFGWHDDILPNKRSTHQTRDSSDRGMVFILTQVEALPACR